MIRTISDFFDSNGLKMFLPRRLSKLIELIFSCADAIFIAIFLFFLFSHSLFDFKKNRFIQICILQAYLDRDRNNNINSSRNHGIVLMNN